ncbi:Zn-finger domain-containing protein [Sclerotinia borealis F-4128]|uniref:Zn-finger domain-containing protein n=1 Tax=Sclerotinia borealis (strain F-4128) TaxID=1432307 RepID=W9CDR4_SCLBF|nr:Zn-finger domain-containing protein [Sclerotinia borealis F-4128]
MKLPDDATVVPIILASDKTAMTKLQRDLVAWPVYMTVGNLSREIRRKQKIPGVLLIGFIPVIRGLSKAINPEDLDSIVVGDFNIRCKEIEAYEHQVIPKTEDDDEWVIDTDEFYSSYTSMMIPELRALFKSRGLKGISKMKKKGDFVTALMHDDNDIAVSQSQGQSQSQTELALVID